MLEANFREDKNKEFVLREPYLKTHLYFYLMKPHPLLTGPMNKASNRLWIKWPSEELLSALLTDWRLYRTATKLLYLIEEKLLKRARTRNWSKKKESTLHWLKTRYKMKSMKHCNTSNTQFRLIDTLIEKSHTSHRIRFFNTLKIILILSNCPTLSKLSLTRHKKWKKHLSKYLLKSPTKKKLIIYSKDSKLSSPSSREPTSWKILIYNLSLTLSWKLLMKREKT